MRHFHNTVYDTRHTLMPQEPKKSSHYWKLINELKKHSTKTHHTDIIEEFEYVSTYERVWGVCTCGKVGIVEHNIIRNKRTGETVDPIGSSCIGYFSGDLKRDFKSGQAEYMKAKRERIASELVYIGESRGITLYELAKKDPGRAAWLLAVNKFTTDRSNPCYHPDNKEKRRQLEKGIRDHAKMNKI